MLIFLARPSNFEVSTSTCAQVPPLNSGLALERERARAFNAGIRADEVEQRREAVRARNRSAA